MWKHSAFEALSGRADALGWTLAVGAHVAIVAAVATGPRSPAPAAVAAVSSEVVLEELPPPPPPPPPPPIAPESHASAPARAAAALVVPPAPDAPPPPPEDTVITGDADTYQGGITAENGTGNGKGAGDGLAEGDAPPPPPPPPPPPDRSRAARCPLDVDWDCEFPDGESVGGVVVFSVHVGRDGTVTATDVIAAPSTGLARAAQLCAAQRRCEPALDPAGRIASGVTNPIRMRFVR